jgi:hypothetical protein
MSPEVQSFLYRMESPLRRALFLLMRLPSAFFSGVRIRQLTEETCSVSVPYSWFSKNPFRSTYFACLAMAAEMSTGTLALMHIYRQEPALSMLVVELQANFFKKATGRTLFVCSQGADFREAAGRAMESGEPVRLVARSSGTNSAGETVAEFQVTWSFKAKKIVI